MNRRIHTCALGAIFAGALVLPAAASVDPSAKPGGVYGLKPGIYITAGIDCEKASPAQARRYDGKGIGSATTRFCSVIVRVRNRHSFVVDQSCRFARGRAGERLIQRQRVRIHDALTFTQTVGGTIRTYRYCPAYQLSSELHQVFR